MDAPGRRFHSAGAGRSTVSAVRRSRRARCHASMHRKVGDRARAYGNCRLRRQLTSRLCICSCDREGPGWPLQAEPVATLNRASRAGANGLLEAMVRHFHGAR